MKIDISCLTCAYNLQESVFLKTCLYNRADAIAVLAGLNEIAIIAILALGATIAIERGLLALMTFLAIMALINVNALMAEILFNLCRYI